MLHVKTMLYSIACPKSGDNALQLHSLEMSSVYLIVCVKSQIKNTFSENQLTETGGKWGARWDVYERKPRLLFFLLFPRRSGSKRVHLPCLHVSTNSLNNSSSTAPE